MTPEKLFAKRASDEYVYFRKKITDKPKIKLIKQIGRDLVLTDNEVCEKILFEGLAAWQKKINQ